MQRELATLAIAIDARRAKEGGKQAEKAIDGVTKKTDKATKAGKGLTEQQKKQAAQTKKMTKAVKGLAAGLSGLFIFNKLKTTIAEFGDTMATLRAVLGATDATMVQVTKRARELGSTTRFSASEAGEGLVFLARAGFDTDEAIAAIEPSLNLAAAGAISLGEAADFASNILKQFGLEAVETERVTDVLVTTANSANTDVRGLAEALKYAGPVAGSIGQSMEETAAAIGALGDAGIQGSMAGTSLRGVFAALLGPTSQAKKAFKDMEISIDEIDPSMHSLVDIFKVFEDRNLSASKALDIFGRRNAAAALILTGSTESMDELNGKLDDAAGNTKEAADIMNDTLGGALKALTSAMEEAMLATGDAGFTGVLRGLVDGVTGGLRVFLGMADSSERANSAFKAVARTLKLILTLMAALVVIKIAAFFVTLAVAIKKAVLAWKAMDLAMTATPWGLLLKGAVLLGGAIWGLSGDFDQAEDSGSRFADTMIDINDKITEMQNRLKQGETPEALADEILRARISNLQQIVAALEKQDDPKFPAIWRKVPRRGGGGETVGAGVEEIRKLQATLDSKDVQQILGGRTFEDMVSSPSAVNLREIIDGINAWIKSQKDLTEETKTSARELAAQAKAALELVDAQEKAFASIDKITDSYTKRRMALKDLSQEEAKERDLRLAEAVLRAAPTPDDPAAAKEHEERIKTRLVQLRNEIDLTHLRENQAEAAAKAEEKRVEAKEATDEQEAFITNLKNEVEALKETALQKQINANIEAYLSAVKKEGREATAAELIEIEELTVKLHDEAVARQAAADGQREQAMAAAQMKAAQDAYKTYLSDLEFERDLIGKSNEERQILIQLRQAEDMMIAAGLPNREEALKKLREELEAMQDRERFQQMFDSIADGFVNFFESIIDGVDSVEDALENLLRNISKIVFDELFGNTLREILKNLPTFFGGGGESGGGTGSGGGGAPVFSSPESLGLGGRQGMVLGYQRGGIINSPVTFPAGGAGIARAGETGMEAIVPLGRTTDGDLGIKGAGSGTTVVMNITTKDANSFRQSRRQIMEDMRLATESYGGR